MDFRLNFKGCDMMSFEHNRECFTRSHHNMKEYPWPHYAQHEPTNSNMRIYMMECAAGVENVLPQNLISTPSDLWTEIVTGGCTFTWTRTFHEAWRQSSMTGFRQATRYYRCNGGGTVDLKTTIKAANFPEGIDMESLYVSIESITSLLYRLYT